MSTRNNNLFITIRSEGGLLPVDLLQRVAGGDSTLIGLTTRDYHLNPAEKINEAINRSWTRLIGSWTSLKSALANLSPSDPAVSLTRERWLMPLFESLGYGRLIATKSIEISGKTYPVSHVWQNTIIHLVGFGVDLDRRSAGVAGASKSSPHSLVQELLNRSESYLWAFVSNGRTLRLLRDNLSLTRQSYIEFDLQAMMDGEIYSDFALLWLLCHVSRVEAEKPEDCWLEKWSKEARLTGVRVRDELRNGVEESVKRLGCGFLSHPLNHALKEKLDSGTLSAQDYYRQLLRLIYKLLFLFVAEDRGLLMSPQSTTIAKARYISYYSTARLRNLASKRRGTRHVDLWQAQQIVFSKLGQDSGCSELALPALGSFLWSTESTPDLDQCTLSNRHYLEALRALAYTENQSTYRTVDFRNLRSEELGSIYESLLELHPHINLEDKSFDLLRESGHERKKTGSYYTPESLVSCLLDSALDPVIKEARAKKNPTEAILNLKICDPACGSGHFLIAAAHRVAKQLASVRTGDEEPAPEAYQTALRDVVSRCIYGVDLNELAVELCKVNLWLDSLEPGKPLSFLDHKIKCGNSLIGATPELIEQGIPNGAFNAIEGDDKSVVSMLRKQNKEAYLNLQQLPTTMAMSGSSKAVLRAEISQLDNIDNDSIIGLHAKESRFRKIIEGSEFKNKKLLADAWCAAFVWRKIKEAPNCITSSILNRIRYNPDTIPQAVLEEIKLLTRQYNFFHWHLEFPQVFYLPSDNSLSAEKIEHIDKDGFDVVLGNPPWERIKLQEREWFASRAPEIASATNTAERGKLIESIKTHGAPLYREFLNACRQAEGESHFVRNSQRFPLCGRGDINTYSIFTETMCSIINRKGKVGCIVPSGLATDDTTKYFFDDIMSKKSIISLYDFENRNELFANVHRSYKFSLVTLTGRDEPAEHGGHFVCFALNINDLKDKERHFTLTADDIALLNPNTKTCAIFRSKRDAELTKIIYQRVPVLIKEGPPEENPWGLKFVRMFDMSNDAGLFHSKKKLEACTSPTFSLKGNVFMPDRNDFNRYMPLYEAKMIHQFDHRWATYEGNEGGKTRDVTDEEEAAPDFVVLPYDWITEGEVKAKLTGKWDHKWLLGWRRICRSTDERSFIATIVGNAAVGDSLFLAVSKQWEALIYLLANLNAFVCDYVVRQKIGGTNLNFFIVNQLPALSPATYKTTCSWNPHLSFADWIHPRCLELIYTSHELKYWAQDCGYHGDPFQWNIERRFIIRCELDAAFFHLYGITRDDVDYIMETFPIVKRNDETKYGEYRTKQVILEIYDRLTEAIASGTPYKSSLNPLPGNASALNTHSIHSSVS